MLSEGLTPTVPRVTLCGQECDITGHTHISDKKSVLNWRFKKALSCQDLDDKYAFHLGRWKVVCDIIEAQHL